MYFCTRKRQDEGTEKASEFAKFFDSLRPAQEWSAPMMSREARGAGREKEPERSEGGPEKVQKKRKESQYYNEEFDPGSG